MKYFAMIDGNRVGPLELYELPDAGVTPDTYVWHKGLDDWQKAEDDGDICRMMRRRLAGLPYGAPEPLQPDSGPRQTDDGITDNRENYPVRARSHIPPDVDPLPPPGSFEPDISRPPTPMVLMAFLSTLLCFPPTGLIALYFAWRSRHRWDDAWRNQEGFRHTGNPEAMRREAHEYARMAKMWTGITFFLGLIMYSFLILG